MSLEHSHDHGSGSVLAGSAKLPFLLGLFVGIASSSLVALFLLSGMVFSGKLGLNALAAAANVPSAPSAPTAPTGNEIPTPPAAPLKPVDEKVDHILGPKNAKITLVEYSDFECPFCKRHLPTVKELLKAYPNDVRLVYRHYPLPFHPQAMPAAVASECVAELGGNEAFWKFHDRVFEAPTMNADLYKQIAKDLKLDEKKFNDCVASNKYQAKIDKEAQEGGESGVQGTPATFVNGQLIEGAVPVATFKSVIDGLLKK